MQLRKTLKVSPRYLSNNMDRYIFVKDHDPGQDVYWVVDLTRLISREVVPQPLCLWEVLLDSSSQISHMFWACRVLNTKRIGTMLWTGTCVYSPKVMVILPCHWDLTLVTACQWYVDMVEGCNSFGEFLFLKGRLCGI